MYRKKGKVRVISTSRQLTLPHDCRFEPGDEIDIRWDEKCILLTPPDIEVDEERIREAVHIGNANQTQ